MYSCHINNIAMSRACTAGITLNLHNIHRIVSSDYCFWMYCARMQYAKGLTIFRGLSSFRIAPLTLTALCSCSALVIIPYLSVFVHVVSCLGMDCLDLQELVDPGREFVAWLALHLDVRYVVLQLRGSQWPDVTRTGEGCLLSNAL